MAHYPTCHDEKIWRKKILPYARLPRLSGDEHLPVIDVCLHGCMCVCLCMHMRSVYMRGVRACVFLYWCVAVCAYRRGLLIPWQAELSKQSKQCHFKNPPDAHTWTDTYTHAGNHTHAHTRTLFVIWHVICENKPQSGHSDGGDSSCLSAARAECLPQ